VAFFHSALHLHSPSAPLPNKPPKTNLVTNPPQQLVGFALACLSLVVVWSEATIFTGRQPDLSPFSLAIRCVDRCSMVGVGCAGVGGGVRWGRVGGVGVGLG